MEQILLAIDPLYLPALFFGVLGLAQLFAKHTFDPIATRGSLIAYWTCLLFFAMAGTLFATASQKWWLRFTQAITTYTMLLSLFAIMQFFTSPDSIYWTVVPRWSGYIFGPYVNHNHYAGLMEMLIPITTMCWMSTPYRGPAAGFSAFTVLIALASVALSGSRAGVSIVAVEVIILVIIDAVRQHRKPAIGRRFSTVGIAAIIAVLLAVWMLPSEVSKRLETLADSPQVTLADRQTMTRDTFRIFRAYFWSGIGLGSFESIYPQFQTLVMSARIGHAHNDFAEVLAETGIAGGAMVIVALVLFFTGAGRRVADVTSRRYLDRVSAVCLGAGIGCCGILLHSFFDFNLHIPANAAWFATCAGWWKLIPPASTD